MAYRINHAGLLHRRHRRRQPLLSVDQRADRVAAGVEAGGRLPHRRDRRGPDGWADPGVEGAGGRGGDAALAGQHPRAQAAQPHPFEGQPRQTAPADIFPRLRHGDLDRRRRLGAGLGGGGDAAAGGGAEPLRHRRPIRPLFGDGVAARLVVWALRPGAVDPVQELQPRRTDHGGMPGAGDPPDLECRRLCAEVRRAALGGLPALAEAGAAQRPAVHVGPAGDGWRHLSGRAAGRASAGMVQLYRPLALRPGAAGTGRVLPAQPPPGHRPHGRRRRHARRPVGAAPGAGHAGPHAPAEPAPAVERVAEAV